MRARPFVGALILGLTLVVLATARGADPRLYPPASGQGVIVYLIDNGFHTDLGLPGAAMALGDGPAAIATRIAGSPPWIEVGWGDARFYTEPGLSSARVVDGFRALFAPDNPSVLRLERLDRAPDRIYLASAVRRLVVSRQGLAAMERRIDTAFARAPDGSLLVQPVAADPRGRFYRSAEHFSLLHVCNHWTAQVLNAGGLPVTPVLDTLPAGLRLDLRLRTGTH